MEKKNHPVISSINSWLFNALSGYMDLLFGVHKNRLFKDHPDLVV